MVNDGAEGWQQNEAWGEIRKPCLVGLQYKFEEELSEPYDEWPKAIDSKCNKVFDNFIVKEGLALTIAFSGQEKRSLNRVFEAIGFFYLNYPYLAQGSRERKKKEISKPQQEVLKQKRMKLTTKHWRVTLGSKSECPRRRWRLMWRSLLLKKQNRNPPLTRGPTLQPQA